MSFGFLGIQFGFALQNANVSRIFETLGAKVEDIPILWIAAPVTGLIIQPIIGHMSDNTWNRLGRRRPYFLVGAILASIALLIMPNSPALWVAAGMLWIMDASINISMEPFRAFVGDMLPSEQRTKGFAMQSFFIGTGAVIASALPYIMTNWLNIANTAPDGQIPPSVKFSFYIGGAIFLIAVLWTVIRTKEYSPEEIKEFQEERKEQLKIQNEQDEILPANRFLKSSIFWLIGGAILAILVFYFRMEAELYILGFGLIVYGLVQVITGSLIKSGREKNGFVEVIMPATMKQLAIVQFFSWFALFAMWIYTTAAVTNHIYGTSDSSSEIYNEGANWVGILFAVYNGFAAIVAFLLPVLAKYTNRKITHLIALVAGGLGLISIYFFNDPNLLVISMVGVGIAWASILAMPYAILTGSLPQHKLGIYMGIFNFFIVIPQILAASILGFFVRNIANGQAIYALILGGISMIIAGFLTLLVNDVDDPNK
jgi:maltose/moltooligosaccharide transporter